MSDVAATQPRPLRWAPAWVLLFVALWPLHGIAEVVLVLGALTGLFTLLASRFRGGTRLLSGPAWALASVLFAAYWLPEVVSLPGAVDTLQVLRKLAADLCYLPFLWVAASAVASDHGRRIVFTGVAWIALLWTGDALVEVVSGRSPLFWLLDHGRLQLLGEGLCTSVAHIPPDRLGGVLGPCNLKLGIVLACLSPFALEVARRKFGKPGWLVTALAMGVVVVLAGARAAWLTYALVLAGSGWRVLGGRWLALLLAGCVLAVVTAVPVSPQLQQRVLRSEQAMAGDAQHLDVALSGRVRVWSAALCMLRTHPLTGVGVRGFREAFPSCDPQPEQMPVWGDGAALHAHQWVLEVLSETGVLGVLLWLAGIALAWRAWRYADADARRRAHPAMLALAVSLFPLNTHLAVYSTFWGSVVLLLAALYVGSLWGQVALPATDPQR